MSEDYQPYEVALWRWWPSLFPTCAETVYAPTSQRAVLSLMEREHKQRVVRAAIQSADGSIERWLHVDVELLRDGNVCVEVPLAWVDGRIVPVVCPNGLPLVVQGEGESEE
ncbi:MAG: hypothetical protein ACR2H5_00880 [Ktedonobacteraceae bacterium]